MKKNKVMSSRKRYATGENTKQLRPASAGKVAMFSLSHGS